MEGKKDLILDEELMKPLDQISGGVAYLRVSCFYVLSVYMGFFSKFNCLVEQKQINYYVNIMVSE